MHADFRRIHPRASACIGGFIHLSINLLSGISLLNSADYHRRVVISNLKFEIAALLVNGEAFFSVTYCINENNLASLEFGNFGDLGSIEFQAKEVARAQWENLLPGDPGHRHRRVGRVLREDLRLEDESAW